MRAILKIISSIGRSEPPLTVAGRPLALRRSAQARRLRLAVDPRCGTVRLTIPQRYPLARALAWAEGERAWVEEALARLAPAVPIVAGGSIPFEGAPLRVDWQVGASRRPLRMGERLVLGGEEANLATRVQQWLRREALIRLQAESLAFAERAGVTIGRVSVGDARGRWGSCSAAGDLRYSWRLVMAPPEVRRATAAHEVAHRLHMDHSPAFHRAVATIFGRAPDAERAWLRRNGAALHRVGQA
jgi:predicted metal-dependent hydrolase